MKINILKMILSYLINVLTYLKAIHIGTLLVQFKATIKLGILLSPLIFLVEKLSRWGIDNSDYIIVVLFAIAIDHVLGTTKHLYFDKDFTIKKNLKGLVIKIGLVVACGFLFEGLQVIVHKESLVTEYLKITLRLIVFLYPAGSAFGNSSIISNGKFPPQSWLDRLKKFQENLNPKEIVENKETT